MEGAPGTGQDDARPAAPVDPAAAEPRRRDRGHAAAQRRRAARRGADHRAAVSRPAPHDLTVRAGRRRFAAAAGEATLAHHGVLFLDELSEFQRPALDSLRQPLEDGGVMIVRGQRSLLFPTRFMLVAATNPCPCGYAGVGDRCSCGELDLRRHRRRLSGPLLDRIDLLVDVRRPEDSELRAPPRTSSEQALARVSEARQRQRRRLRGSGARCNGEMDARTAQHSVRLDEAGWAQLGRAYEAGR